MINKKIFCNKHNSKIAIVVVCCYVISLFVIAWRPPLFAIFLANSRMQFLYCSVCQGHLDMCTMCHQRSKCCQSHRLLGVLQSGVIPCQICMKILDPFKNVIFVSYHHN